MCSSDLKGFDAVYSELNLDSQEVVPIPKMAVNTCQLITGIDNDKWQIQGIPQDLADQQKKAEKHFGALGINMFATCTPYQVGNVPVTPAVRESWPKDGLAAAPFDRSG